MKPTTITSLSTTIAVFTRALSWMPITSSTVSSAMMSARRQVEDDRDAEEVRGRVEQARVRCAWSTVVDSQSGRCSPSPARSDLK